MSPYGVAPADGFVEKLKGPPGCAGIIRRRSKRDLPFLHYPVRPSNHSKRYRVMSPITSPLPTGSLDNRKVPFAALASFAAEANGTFPSCTTLCVPQITRRGTGS